MVKSYSRGHEIYLDEKVWRYVDNDEILCEERPCKRCGEDPTKEGYDACKGYIEGATSVCCGHGVEKEVIMMKEKGLIDKVEEMAKEDLTTLLKEYNVKFE